MAKVARSERGKSRLERRATPPASIEDHAADRECCGRRSLAIGGLMLPIAAMSAGFIIPLFKPMSVEVD